MKPVNYTLSLLIVMCFTLNSCGASDVIDTSTDSSEITTTAPETEDRSYKDDIPELDFEGYEFRIYTRHKDWFHGDMMVDEANGEILNDAIYDRGIYLSQRFNIEITEQYGDDTTVAKNTVLAAEDAFDLINMRCTESFNMAQEGYSIPLDEVKYLDFDKGYWNQTLSDSLNLGTKQYFPVCDMNLTFYDYACVMIFNKEIAAEYGNDDFYSLVENGDWTYDKYLSLAVEATSDLDGNSIYDDNDQYGTLGSLNLTAHSFLMSWGVKSINKDADNMPVFNIASDQMYVERWEKMLSALYQDNQWYDTKTGGQADDVMNSFFRSDKALFYATTLYEINALRDMESDFGILPYPKFDKQQQDYITRVAFFDMMTIPVTNTHTDIAGAFIEAGAAYSYEYVIPAYFDITIQQKATRDTESIDMLYLIRDTRVIDFGDTILSDKIRDGYQKQMVQNKNPNIVSESERVSGSINDILTKIRENFK